MRNTSCRLKKELPTLVYPGCANILMLVEPARYQMLQCLYVSYASKPLGQFLGEYCQNVAAYSVGEITPFGWVDRSLIGVPGKDLKPGDLMDL